MSMSAPVKRDGFGVRRNASDNEVANMNEGIKFATFYATETLAKGDAVCFDVDVVTYGVCNNVRKALVSNTLYKACIGVAAEAVTVSATDYQLVQIQVEGLVSGVAIDDTGDGEGDYLSAGATAGQLTIQVAGAMPVGILITEGTAGTKDSTVWLTNPANI